MCGRWLRGRGDGGVVSGGVAALSIVGPALRSSVASLRSIVGPALWGVAALGSVTCVVGLISGRGWVTSE